MRLFEFARNEDDDIINQLYLTLKNLQGRYASKKIPAPFNWRTIEKLSKVEIDSEIFQAIYDNDETGRFQKLVKDFDQNGLELRVPGTDSTDAGKTGAGPKQDSQAAVDKIAASSAPQQLSQQTQSLS